jgi:hypothetical protein
MKRLIASLMISISSAAADDTSKLLMTEGQWEVKGDITMQSSNGTKQTSPAPSLTLCLTNASPVPLAIEGGADVNVSMKLTGKYLGACPK